MIKEHRKNLSAVEVVNVSKGYGKRDQLVLKCLNFTVKSGTIYGILGSSGCGKTTLLSCIVGLQKPHCGQVLLFGEKVHKVPRIALGYMPQDAGLYDSFTIQETFSYFANMYNIPPTVWGQRLHTLKELLSFPKLSSYVRNLSGGEKRRVSFALTLLHQPRLLVVDEPTVGVDPLLRERIWDYLIQLVECNGITVLVTTHYTQEASNCNKIGILRNGRLLVEEQPQLLLDRFKTNLLEKVVLDICRQDDLSPNAMPVKCKKDKEQNSIEDSAYTEQNLHYNIEIKMEQQEKQNISRLGDSIIQTSIEQCSTPLSSNVRIMKGLVKRNWINVFRHFQLVVILVAIPIVHVLLGVYVIGIDPKGLGMAVVNRDNFSTDDQNQLTNKGVPKYCNGNETSYSCNFMKQLSPMVNLEVYAAEGDALRSVIDGNTMGYLMIPPNFTNNLQDRLLFRLNAENETLDGSTIGVRLDMSQYIRNVFMFKTLTDGLGACMENIIKGFGMDPRVVSWTLKFNAIYGSVASTWRDYFLPAYIIFSCFILQTVVGLFHIQDRKSGTFQRTLCTGVTHSQVMASYLLSTTPILVVQIIVMILIMASEVEIAGSWCIVFLQCFLAGLSGAALGLMCATVFDHEMEVVVGILFIFLSCQALSGITWPLDDVVWWYRIVCYALPLTAPLTAMRSTMNRGWGISHPQIILGLGASVTYIVGCLIVIMCITKYKFKNV